MSESKSAVAAAERANVSQAAEASAATASAGVEGQAQGVRMKVAAGIRSATTAFRPPPLVLRC